MNEGTYDPVVIVIVYSETQYNDNIKHCGLCCMCTSHIEKAKYNTHGQAKYNDDGRFTCSCNKCNALVQYIQVLCMNITKTKHNNVIYYCICLSNVVTD